MSIQFRCQSCKQSLQVPDGSSGKKVRCPQCETVNIIPEAVEDGPESATPRPLPPQPSADFENPFAPPLSSIAQPQSEYTPGALTRQTINMGDVLGQAWQRFKPTLITSALFGLVWGGIAVGSGIVGQAMQGGAAAFGDPNLAIVATVLSFVIQQVFSAYQQTMGKRYGLNVVRGSTEVMSGIFTFDKVLRVLIFFLLIAGLSFVVFLIVASPAWIATVIDGGNRGPVMMIGAAIAGILGILAVFGGIFLMMRISLSIFFIVDRDATVTEAMQQSNIYMTGNCATVFFTMLLVGIGTAIFGLITCFLGFLVALPYLETVQAMIYSKVTGQYQNI